MENNNDTNVNERPFVLSKDMLDTTNSVAWFFMDAFWMFGLPILGMLFILPTVITGIGLLYIEKRPAVFKINIAINCWIWMNIFWMFSDIWELPVYLTLAKCCFAGGLLSMLAALEQSGNVRETFSHFRRFRTFHLRN